MKLRRLGLGAAFALAVTIVAGTAEAQLKDITQIGPTVPGGAINKSFAQQIGAGRGDHVHAGLVALHHRARSLPRDPPRPPDLPAQVHAGAGPRAAHQRRRRQSGLHRRRSQRRGRSGRLLRRLPRPAARLGGLRRRRRHAARQPRRAAPVRPRPEGDAGRRDHDRAARDPRRGARPGRGERGGRDAAARRQGRQLRHASPPTPTARSTRRAWSASIPTSASGRSSRRAGRSPSASSWSARSTPRWAWRASTPT